MSLTISVGRNKDAPLVVHGKHDEVRASIETIVTQVGCKIVHFDLSGGENQLVKDIGMTETMSSQLSTAVARRQVGTSVTFDVNPNREEDSSLFSDFKLKRPTSLQRLLHR